MTSYDVAVIGAGPAGMMAAGHAAELGKKVLLLEKNTTSGRKLLLTGKHRCNLSNIAPVQEALLHFNPGGKFLTQLFYRYYVDELRHFFNQLDVPTIVQRGGRVFPMSERARDIVEALISWNKQTGVELLTRSPVISINYNQGNYHSVVIENRELHTRSIILATGGKSYPGTGSTGEGYAFAKQAGHRIISAQPALVPLVTEGTTAQKLQGLGLKNVTAEVWINQKKTNHLLGEILFTHFGLSGPVILTLSREIVQALHQNKQVEIAIDLKPGLDQKTLESRLLRDIQSLGRKQFQTLLAGLLPQKLIPICSDHLAIPRDKKISQLTSSERNRLCVWLKGGLRFTISSHLGFDHAIITAGGIDTKEVNPRTMESKLVKGLYFAGEILDVDADTGGFNLQAAFSTGWAAGLAAADY